MVLNNGQTQSGPFAIRKLIRSPNGTMTVTYVDPQNGQQINNLAGYQIVDVENADSLEDLGLNPTKTEEDKSSTTTADKVKESVAPSINEHGYSDEMQSEGRGLARSPSNNYGYFNKPAGFGMAAGLFGTAGQLVDKGINLNNAAAIDEARKSMGLESKGLGGLISGTLFGSTDGRVADVKVGNSQYSVGFEALDKYGRTSMTPEEARRRAEALDTPITEASKKEVRSDVKSFKDEFQPSKGNTIAGTISDGISGLVSGVGDFFSSLFGDGTTQSAPRDNVSDWGLSDYPEAPGGYSGEMKQTTYSDFLSELGAFDNATSSGGDNNSGGGYDSSRDYSGLGGEDSPGEGKR